MFSCDDSRAIEVMERDRLGRNFEEEHRLCSQCGENLDEDDCFRYEDLDLCATCLKEMLFEELGEDYRIR